MTSLNKNIVFEQTPNIKVNTKEVFGVECEFIVQGFNEKRSFEHMRLCSHILVLF